MNTKLILSESQLRTYLEKMAEEITNIEINIPQKENRNPRKSELAYADGIRLAARELLNTLGLKDTWLEEIQMDKGLRDGYKGLGYSDQDDTYYFGFYKTEKAFIDAYLEETGQFGLKGVENWVRDRIESLDRRNYGVEAWVNRGTLCVKEVPCEEEVD